ncbi:DUF7940 domain-containing protein [Eoetvoesiella caeni]
MKLIPEWKKCLRMFSVQAMLIAGSIQGAWLALPVAWQSSFPEPWVRGITIAVLVLGAIGRLVQQPKVSGGA